MKRQTKWRKWRIIPQVSFLNWKKERCYFPGLWAEWFCVRRAWGNRLIYIHVRHFMLTLDFRHSWINDMLNT